MTETSPPATEAEITFARLHLRMGLLALARAELEALAARAVLDDEAMVDLAEVRWRTGDLPAAGEAAQAHLDAGGHQRVAYVIAAEAVAAAGRPTEARRLVGRALGISDDPLDEVFAGMPRSVIWPTDRATDAEHAGMLFDVHPPESVPQADAVPPRPGAGAPDVRPATPSPSGTSGTSAAAQTPGLWDARPAAAPDATLPDATLPDAQEQLDAARAALAAGEPDRAAINLAIVLRAAPVLAPAVLSALAGAPVGAHASLELVRGDAYRLVGHETDARRAFAAAAAALQRVAEPPATEPPANEAGVGPPDGAPGLPAPEDTEPEPARPTEPHQEEP